MANMATIGIYFPSFFKIGSAAAAEDPVQHHAGI